MENVLDWTLAVGKRSGSSVRAASVGAESEGANGTGISGLATEGSLWCDVVVISVVVRLRTDISVWSGVGSRSLAIRSTAVRSTTESGSTVWGLLESERWEIELLGTAGGDLLGEEVVTVVIGFGSVDIIGVGLLSEAETTWAKEGALGSVVWSPDWARAERKSAAERARATVRSTTESKTSTASESAVGDLLADTTISFAESTIVIRGVEVVVLVEDLLEGSSPLGSVSGQLAVAERASSAERTHESGSESTAKRGGATAV